MAIKWHNKTLEAEAAYTPMQIAELLECNFGDDEMAEFVIYLLSERNEAVIQPVRQWIEATRVSVS